VHDCLISGKWIYPGYGNSNRCLSFGKLALRRYSRTIVVKVETSIECAAAIRTGDIDLLNRILEENPVLVKSRVDGQRTLLHVATDWPGHFPNVRASVSALVLRGADVNAAFVGLHSEKPLHWAASSDDIDALDALLDHGADIEAPGGVIGGGTPLADAVAFGQWRAAHRLVERGARTVLWQAATLGLIRRVEECFTRHPPPAPAEITNALWCACNGGHLSSTEYLFDRGADLNWVGHDELSPLDAAKRSGAQDLVVWLSEHGARSAKASN
jgi:ankyrin repeat protein